MDEHIKAAHENEISGPDLGNVYYKSYVYMYTSSHFRETPFHKDM